MSTQHLLDPELLPLVSQTASLNANNLQKARDARFGDDEVNLRGVGCEEIQITREDGPDVRALLFTPPGKKVRPAYLQIHGGGYIMGSPEGSSPMNALIAASLDIVVLAVSYRLAPEHSVPSALHDCYEGLAWLHNNAERLGLDSDRIAIGGESAGGGLAAALAIYARDQGKYPVCHQHLTYPMLDDRTGTDESPGDPLVGEFIWTRGNNRFGWESYLGDSTPAAPSVPARLEKFEGLPPTWLLTADLDLFRDENIEYAQKLMRAGIATELVVIPRACHGFQMVPGTKVGKRYIASHLEALSRALDVELRRSK